MAQPTPYIRRYDFVSWQTINPLKPLPAQQVENEYNAIKVTLDGILRNVKLIQRDDGQIANQTVGWDQLKPEVVVGINEPTQWAPNKNYLAGDLVYANDRIYRCLVTHLSGPGFDADLAAGYWTVQIDFVQASSEAIAARDAALVAQAAAEAAADSFDDTYLGAFAAAPTLDNDGNALKVGALYFNTVDSELKVWNGTKWEYAAASGQPLVNTFNTRSGAVVLSAQDVTATGVLAGYATQAELAGYATDAELAANATATATALNAKADRTGPTGALVVPSGTTAQRPPSPQRNWLRYNSGTNKYETWDGTAWVDFAAGGGGGGTGAVDSVNGQTGVVVLTAADVGAIPVGGTTAPVIIAATAPSPAVVSELWFNSTTNELYVGVDPGSGAVWRRTIPVVDLSGYLPLSGGTLTGGLNIAGGGLQVAGDLIAQKPGPNENSTLVPTTSWVKDQIAAIPGGGGGTPGPITDHDANATYAAGSIVVFQAEIVRAKRSTGPGFNPADWAIYLTDTSAAKINSPAFTGNPTAPTPAPTDNDTSIATTEFVKTALAGISAPDVTKAYVDAANATQDTAIAGNTASIANKYDKAGGALNGPSAPKVVDLGNRSGAIVLDLASADDFSMTLNANASNTLGIPTGALRGQSGVVHITQGAGGSFTLAFDAVWDWEGGTVPSLSTAAGAVDALVYSIRSASGGAPSAITARLMKGIA